MKVYPTANYKATKEYFLEQASLKRDAHFDDKGRQDKPVPLEVDALLAKVSTLKDAQSDGDEAGGIQRSTKEEKEGKVERWRTGGSKETAIVVEHSATT